MRKVKGSAGVETHGEAKSRDALHCGVLTIVADRDEFRAAETRLVIEDGFITRRGGWLVL